MAENQKLAKMHGTQQTSRDTNKTNENINFLVRAMKADFGHKFKSVFDDERDLKDLKQRLRSIFDGSEVQNIFTAYDLYVEQGNDWPPTVPKLSALLKDVEAKGRRDRESLMQAQMAAALPKLTISCDPLAMLSKAKMTAGERKTKTHDEWLQRKEEARLLNNSLTSGIVRRYASHFHLCGLDGCNRAGSISRSTTGSDSWFCAEHYVIT